jgi:hypothetical protein
MKKHDILTLVVSFHLHDTQGSLLRDVGVILEIILYRFYCISVYWSHIKLKKFFNKFPRESEKNIIDIEMLETGHQEVANCSALTVCTVVHTGFLPALY